VVAGIPEGATAEQVDSLICVILEELGRPAVAEKPLVELLEKGKDVDGHPVSDGSGVSALVQLAEVDAVLIAEVLEGLQVKSAAGSNVDKLRARLQGQPFQVLDDTTKIGPFGAPVPILDETKSAETHLVLEGYRVEENGIPVAAEQLREMLEQAAPKMPELVDCRILPAQAFVSTTQTGAKEVHGSALLIYKNAHDARTACDLVNGVQVESSNTVLWVRKPGTKNWAKGKGKGAAAQKAAAGMDGRRLQAAPGQQMIDKNKLKANIVTLHAVNLDSALEDDEVEALFAEAAGALVNRVHLLPVQPRQRCRAAYVEFMEAEQAELARKTLDGVVLKPGQAAIKVTVKGDKSVLAPRELVEVTGLPEKLRDEAEVAAILEPIAGRTLRIEPQARGNAYIDCVDAAVADDVVIKLHQAPLPNDAGLIEAKRVPPHPDDIALLYIHWDPKLETDKLAEFLETKLNLRNATLEFGKKGGTGFARLSSEEAAQEAVKLKAEVDDVTVFIEQPISTEVYFGGLPPDFDELCLRGFCAKEAEISVRSIRTVRMVPSPRPNTAAGVVTFLARHNACQAIVRLHGQLLDRAPVIVAWKADIDALDSARQMPPPDYLGGGARAGYGQSYIPGRPADLGYGAIGGGGYGSAPGGGGFGSAPGRQGMPPMPPPMPGPPDLGYGIPGRGGGGGGYMPPPPMDMRGGLPPMPPMGRMGGLPPGLPPDPRALGMDRMGPPPDFRGLPPDPRDLPPLGGMPPMGGGRSRSPRGRR